MPRNDEVTLGQPSVGSEPLGASPAQAQRPDDGAFPEAMNGTAGTGFTGAALAVHVSSLLLAAGVIAWPARGLQFYYDDWALIAALNRGDFSVSWLLAPHNEHWILLPKLVFSLLGFTAGAGSVWPYVAVTILLHLVLCHLLWRVAVRGGSDLWFATIAAAGFALYGAGVEDILFSVQMGLVGSMVLGTATILELNSPRPRPAIVIVLSVLNVMTFGLAPVFLSLSCLLLAVQRRNRELWMLAPPTMVFLAWYAVQTPAAAGEPRSVEQLLLLPLYWAMGVGNAMVSVVPWRSAEDAVTTGLDPAAALLACAGVALLLVILLATERERGLRPDRMVTVFLLGLPAVVVLSSIWRVEYGLGYAMLSRYTYVGTAFLLPFLICFLTRLVAGHRRARTATLTAVGVLAAANAITWWPVAEEWSDLTRTTARTLAAGQQMQRSGEPLLDEMAATAEFAFLSPADLASLDLSQVTSEVTQADQMSARLAGQVVLEALPPSAVQCSGTGIQELAVPLASPSPVFKVSRTSSIGLSLHDEFGGVSGVRAPRLPAGLYQVRSVAPGASSLVVADTTRSGVLSSCVR